MGSSLVSVILPFYRDMPYVESALASIAGQTFGEFEVVMADDLGSDGSAEVCASWAKRDSRFRLVRDGHHLGMTGNWNRGLRECVGDYVVKLDADDVMRPRFLEQLVRELEADSSVVAVFCRTLDCDEALEPRASYRGEQVFYRRDLDPLQRHANRGHEWLRFSFDGYQLWTSNALMMRRAVLQSMGGWDERWGCAADTDLVLRILERDELVVHHPYCGVWYRRREGSVSDLYVVHGWKAIEGVLVHLGVLSRQYKSRRGLDRQLRLAWHRYWEDWRGIATRLESQDEYGLPPGLRGVDLRAMSRELSPPRYVRFGFWLRRTLGVMRRWVSPRDGHLSRLAAAGGVGLRAWRRFVG